MKSLVRCICILLLLIPYSHNYAQQDVNEVKDSLFRLLEVKIIDTLSLNKQIDVLGEIWANGYEFESSEFRRLQDEAIRLNQKSTKAELEEAELLFWILNNNVDSVLQRSAKFLLDAKQNQSKTEWSLYNMLGNFYLAMDQPKKSIEAYRKSIDILERSKRTDQIAAPLGNLALSYIEAEAYDDALEIIKKANILSHQIPDSIDRITNVSIDLLTIGTILNKKEEYSSALDTLNRALDFSYKQSNRSISLSIIAEMILANIELNQNERIESLIDQVSFEISEDNGLIKKRGYAYFLLAQAKYFSANGKKALPVPYDSITTLNFYTYNSTFRKDLIKFGINHFSKTGNFKKAFEILNQEQASIDEINIDLRKQVNDLIEEKFLTEKLNRENQELKEVVQRRKMYSIAFILLFIPVLVWMILQYRFNKKTLSLNNQLKESNQSIQNYNNELERLTYITTHDLKEPANTIATYSKLIKNKYLPSTESEAHNLFAIVNNTANEMLKVISRLFSYLNLGQNSELSTLNFKEIIEEVKSSLSAEINDSNAKITYGEFPKDIVGYKSEIFQLFKNLISNSIKFRTPNNIPVINIKCSENIEFFKFSVDDNGIGVEEKDREQIFDLFRTASISRDYKADGFGLAICKKIISIHHGEIWVEPNNEKGSCFYFTIKKVKV